MAVPKLAEVAGAAPAPAASQVARRLIARFGLVAFGLFHVPLLLNDYPTFGGGGFADDGLSQAWGRIFGHVGLWVARHVFGLTGPMPQALSGDNGDTAEEYGRLLVAVVVGALVAVIWTIADRRRPRAPWVDEALRAVLRYAIALGLASYAVAKLYPVQFAGLAPVSLETRVGELVPMQLLWRFMEYSPVYGIFAGAMELAVVLLVSFRRTATLGALVCLPVMLNVMLLNYCYGVPVKLFATMVVLSAAVLVLYDARRLVDVLVLHRASPAPPPGGLWRTGRWNSARWAVKVALVGGVIVSSIVSMRDASAEKAAARTRPLYGTWEVASHVVGGHELADTAEPGRWRRAAIGGEQLAIRLESGDLLRCQATADDAARRVSVNCPRTGQTGELTWTRTGDELRLEGTFHGASIAATLRRIDEQGMPLRAARFRWLFD